MAKSRSSIFFCQNCGYESAKWMGQCPACHEWNTFAEEPAAAGTKIKSGGGAVRRESSAKPRQLSQIQVDEEDCWDMRRSCR